MSQAMAAVGQQFSSDKAGFPVCRCPASKVSLKEWCDLMKMKPPEQVLAELKARNMSLHDIEDAAGGDVNLDYYPVTITQMPTIDGQQLTPEQFVQYMRDNPDKFFDTNLADFNPYDPKDGTRWASDDPLGSVFNIDMGLGSSWLDWVDNVDDGSVVASEVTNRNWIFSTIYTRGDMAHPVSGNREFGYTNFGREGGNQQEVVVYTRGADRLTRRADVALNATTGPLADAWRHLTGNAAGEPWFGNKGVPFAAADELWSRFQRRVYDFVKSHDGEATIGDRVSRRVDYEAMKKLCK
jgi:hypothetical protein